MRQNQKNSRGTIAVIVSHNPNPVIVGQILESLRNQCPAIIIDNGSTQSSLSALQEQVNKNESVELLHLEKNMGIAHAQNTAIRHIIDTFTESRLVLLLDHDSIPGKGMVDTLEGVFGAIENKSSVAAVGPALFDPRDNKHLDFHKAKFGLWGKIRSSHTGKDNPVLEVDGLNSSGSLISLDAFRIVGEFDSGLFIDHVETDWCFRAKSRGYRLLATPRAELTHHMGDDVCHYWLFGNKRMPYRSPSRHYYIVRNSILLQKRKYVPVSWKFSNILKLLFTFIYFGMYCDNSADQRKQIVRGFIDGLKGTTGPSHHQ